MAVNTGRSHFKYIDFSIDDSGGTIRQIAVNSISGLGLTYDELELTAFDDAVKGFLAGHPGLEMEISGPFDTTASTGSHTVLSGVVGGVTPLALNIQIGMRQAYQAGEPTFGVTGTAANGVLVTSYMVDPASMTYTAKIVPFPGSAAPAWGVAAYT